jgi:hypothetical protein
MKILDKLRAKTPDRDKKIGILATKIGVGAGTAFTLITSMGIAFPPLGLVALGVISAIFGGKAIYHGLKTENPDNEKN